MLVMDSICAYPVPTLSSVPFNFVTLNNLLIHLKDNCTTSIRPDRGFKNRSANRREQNYGCKLGMTEQAGMTDSTI
jgi:hypothetical protein